MAAPRRAAGRARHSDPRRKGARSRRLRQTGRLRAGLSGRSAARGIVGSARSRRSCAAIRRAGRRADSGRSCSPTRGPGRSAPAEDSWGSSVSNAEEGLDMRGAGIVTPPWACGTLGSPVAKRMKKISYSGYRFPPEIIHQAIWLYLRFTLSLRDVEDLLAERGVALSYETIRRWVNHFGPMIAADLRKRRLKPHGTWHLDEVYLKIDGRMVYLWRAVDAEGEVLDVLVQSKRNKHAALKLMRKLLKKYAFVPERLV